VLSVIVLFLRKYFVSGFLLFSIILILTGYILIVSFPLPGKWLYRGTADIWDCDPNHNLYYGNGSYYTVPEDYELLYGSKPYYFKIVQGYTILSRSSVPGTQRWRTVRRYYRTIKYIRLLNSILPAEHGRVLCDGF